MAPDEIRRVDGIYYGNLKSENFQDYVQKSQRNFIFMKSASVLSEESVEVEHIYVEGCGRAPYNVYPFFFFD
jgi:hypothetical protein